MKAFIVTKNMYIVTAQYLKSIGFEITTRMAEADLVQFTGGEDINPALYKEKPHRRTSFNNARDTVELLAFEAAVKMGKRMAGICRCGQLLNVLHGGKMWQDVDGHMAVGNHRVKDLIDDKYYSINSIHHQMMIPDSSGLVLAEAYESLRKEGMHSDGQVKSIYYTNKSHNLGDPEAVLYWNGKIPVLCFQAHPEFDMSGDTGKLYYKYLEMYVFESEIRKVA